MTCRIARGQSASGASGRSTCWCKSGLIEAIDRDVQLLKVHLPYHESDHVLNIAYNILCDGHCLEDLERLRNDEAYLDALVPAGFPIRRPPGTFAGGLNLPGKCSH